MHRMSNTLKKILIILPLIVFTLTGCKELQPMLDKVKPLLEENSATSSGITTTDMINAIKQALSQGVSDSVNLLGSAKGFSLSNVYRIPVPQQLAKPAKLLRKVGQGKYVDEFESRLNRAAEQSVAKAIPVFTAAIKNMTVKDAINIMQGSDDAATVYFKSKTVTKLRKQFLPIIQTATGQTGLTGSYKSLNKKISRVAPSYGNKLVDIDNYVLDKAMDALFDRISIEEKLIRDNPAKRTTELMKTVYGYFEK